MECRQVLSFGARGESSCDSMALVFGFVWKNDTLGGGRGMSLRRRARREEGERWTNVQGEVGMYGRISGLL